MDNHFKALEDKINSMEATLNKVSEALIGNEFNKTGIVHTVAEHHQRLSTLEKQLDRGKWLVIGLSAGSGIGVYEIVQKLLH